MVRVNYNPNRKYGRTVCYLRLRTRPRFYLRQAVRNSITISLYYNSRNHATSWKAMTNVHVDKLVIYFYAYFQMSIKFRSVKEVNSLHNCLQQSRYENAILTLTVKRLTNSKVTAHTTAYLAYDAMMVVPHATQQQSWPSRL